MTSAAVNDVSGLVIGVDFDNTIVIYDGLLSQIAEERRLLSGSSGKSKQEVRDSVRKLPDGEIQWQHLQAAIYGQRINEAVLADKAESFFRACHQQKIPVVIVSHKTEYANYDDTHTNLRRSALNWMILNRFFDADGLGLFEANVYFEETRLEKLRRIEHLGCTHFIDDLPEVLSDPQFPSGVTRIWYGTDRAQAPPKGIIAARSWNDIRQYFFGNDHFTTAQECESSLTRLDR